MVSDEERQLMDYLKSCSVPEDKLLQTLLTSSIEFKKFYESERSKIRSPIIWIHNKKLRKDDQIPTGRLAEIRTLPNGYITIIIHNNPSKLSDSSTIAHELAHQIISEGRFPLIGHYHGCTEPQIISLARHLNEMIHDPLVINKLLECGYDLRDEYLKDCQKGVSSIQKGVNYSGIRSIILTFIYVQNLIENDILFSKSEDSCRKFIEKIEKYHPECKIKGKKIYEFIQTNGFQTPAQVKKIYEKIYEIYPDLRDLTVMYE